MGSLYQAKRDARRAHKKPVEIPVPLREVRHTLRLTIRDLVALMPLRENGTRWSEATVSQAERGGRGASPELIVALAEALRKVWATELVTSDTQHDSQYEAQHEADAS